MPTIIDGTNGIDNIAAGAIQKSDLPTGSVLQVVSATKVDAFITTSSSSTDVPGLSVNITPTSATSRILVVAQILGSGDATTAFYADLVRNSTKLSQGISGSTFNSTIGSYLGSGNLYATHPIVFLDSPATTSSTTYKVQIYGGGGGTVAVNRRAADAVIGASSTITVMEIAT